MQPSLFSSPPFLLEEKGKENISESHIFLIQEQSSINFYATVSFMESFAMYSDSSRSKIITSRQILQVLIIQT